MMGSLLLLAGTALALSDSSNPALHTLAGILENESGSLGAFARLYNQID